MIGNMFIIALFWVFSLDFSGFINEIEDYLTKWLKSPVRLSIPKPWSCFVCMTFWTNLIYLLISGFSFSGLMFVCLSAASTPVISKVSYLIVDFFDRLIQSLYEYFDL